MSKKRIGRGVGSGSGKTSGKGHKGQRSRSGVSIKHEGGQTPKIALFAKRGFRSMRKKPAIVKLEEILQLVNDGKIKRGTHVNSSTLVGCGLLSRNSRVKLLCFSRSLSKKDIEGHGLTFDFDLCSTYVKSIISGSK